MGETEWPRDKDDKPMVKIAASMEETINTGNYQNIKLFASVTRFYEEGNEEGAFEELYSKIEYSLKSKHDEILGELESGNS